MEEPFQFGSEIFMLKRVGIILAYTESLECLIL